MRIILAITFLISSGLASADGEFAWPGEVEEMAELLNSGNRQEVLSGIEKLSAIDIRQSFPHLSPLIDSLDKNIASAATAAIRQRFSPALTEEIESWLKSPFEERRILALEMLGKTTTSLKRVGRLTTDRSPEVREAAVVSLGNIGDANAVPILIAALKDSKATVRVKAAEALANFAAPNAVLPLLATLRDNSRLVQLAAIETLASMNETSAASALVPLLQDDRNTIRETTIEALGRIGGAAEIQPLIKASGLNAPPDEAFLAYMSLASIAKRVSSTDADTVIRHLVTHLAMSSRKDRAREAILHAGQNAQKVLALGLTGTIPSSPREVVGIMQEISSPEATPHLLLELDRNRVIPISVLLALGKTGDDRAFSALLAEVVAKKSFGRTHAAITALENFPERKEEVATVLLPLIDIKTEEKTLTAALETVKGVKSTSLSKKLAVLLTHPKSTPAMRDKVAHVLGLSGSQEVFDTLVARAIRYRSLPSAQAASNIATSNKTAELWMPEATENESRTLLLRALSSADSPKSKLSPCHKWLRANHRRVRIAAIRCTGGSKHQRSTVYETSLALASLPGHSTRSLLSYLDNKSSIIAAAAAWSLNGSSKPQVAQRLAFATKSNNPLLAINASASLAKRGEIDNETFSRLRRHSSAEVRANALVAGAAVGLVKNNTKLTLSSEIERTVAFRLGLADRPEDKSFVSYSSDSPVKETRHQFISVESSYGKRINTQAVSVLRPDLVTRVYFTDDFGEFLDTKFPMGEFVVFATLGSVAK